MILGAIADDLTGATDLALTLSREGMRTIQINGIPSVNFSCGEAEAVVIALKSRTLPADIAVEQSLDAARFLLANGARQIVFKYCSTFDSTPAGNIGQVTEALMELLETQVTIACPAFPANKRTVYQGHLFVGNQLLSDSPMQHHPLTPMKDANLVRVLQQQTKIHIGLIDYARLQQEAVAISAAFTSTQPPCIYIVDALTDSDLRQIGAASADLKLVTGGSAIALGLPDNFRRDKTWVPTGNATAFTTPSGRGVTLAGSCSAATRRQIASAVAASIPSFKLDPLRIVTGDITVETVVNWVLKQENTCPLIYSSADPDAVSQVQKTLGVEQAGTLLETFLAQVAVQLSDHGVNRFVIAGGETSGAVVKALNIPALLIGPEIAAGVPWTTSIGTDKEIALALKSGNFGTDDFFMTAWEMMA